MVFSSDVPAHHTNILIGAVCNAMVVLVVLMVVHCDGCNKELPLKKGTTGYGLTERKHKGICGACHSILEERKEYNFCNWGCLMGWVARKGQKET
jgi:hypothetical protein